MGSELQRAQEFSDRLAELFGADLQAVVLYGSAARGSFREGVSDLNLLVLLREVDAEVLRRGSPLARRWTEAGNRPPLLLGVEEWRRSADVFPIEAADIQDAHRVLWGGDPFQGLHIDREHLRLQCEHELKAKQIVLRERYLLSAGEPTELGALLQESLSTFLVLFRTLLRLVGVEVPAEPGRLIDRAAEQAGFDPGAFHRVLRARDTGTPLRPAADDPVATGYLDAVSAAARFVDRLGNRPAETHP
jgi:predicted nucleotidyltransferase